MQMVQLLENIYLWCERYILSIFSISKTENQLYHSELLFPYVCRAIVNIKLFITPHHSNTSLAPGWVVVARVVVG